MPSEAVNANDKRRIILGNATAVPNRDLGQMLLSSFRYALGRRTLIVGETVTWMELYWPLLERWHRQIQEDIERAIERGEAGMDCDVREWRKILALPVNDPASQPEQPKSSTSNGRWIPR